ncbi:MAG TPA: hypothetical protein VMY43_06385 [Methanothrix sp.]|nr:hypothetical protein [Methanothrix sp.]
MITPPGSPEGGQLGLNGHPAWGLGMMKVHVFIGERVQVDKSKVKKVRI